jgi:hypothetical protein
MKSAAQKCDEGDGNGRCLTMENIRITFSRLNPVSTLPAESIQVLAAACYTIYVLSKSAANFSQPSPKFKSRCGNGISILCFAKASQSK